MPVPSSVPRIHAVAAPRLSFGHLLVDVLALPETVMVLGAAYGSSGFLEIVVAPVHLVGAEHVPDEGAQWAIAMRPDETRLVMVVIDPFGEPPPLPPGAADLCL